MARRRRRSRWPWALVAIAAAAAVGYVFFFGRPEPGLPVPGRAVDAGERITETERKELERVLRNRTGADRAGDGGS